MGIDPSTMVSLVDQLETAGLAKAGPDQRIAAPARLQSHSRAAGFSGGPELAMQVEDDVLRGLSPEASPHAGVAAARRRLSAAAIAVDR